MTKYFSIFLISLLSYSCSKDDPIIPNEEELITFVELSLTPTNGGAKVIFSFEDLDGEGGDLPIIINGILKPNTTYNSNLILLGANSESINEEIVSEALDHQFFYDFNESVDISFEYADFDEEGYPLGLQMVFETGIVSDGRFTFILKHEPDKKAEGVAEGKVLNAGGETDIQINFDMKIEE